MSESNVNSEQKQLDIVDEINQHASQIVALMERKDERERSSSGKTAGGFWILADMVNRENNLIYILTSLDNNLTNLVGYGILVVESRDQKAGQLPTVKVRKLVSVKEKSALDVYPLSTHDLDFIREVSTQLQLELLKS